MDSLNDNIQANEETSIENLLSLIKEQQKEIKMNKKRLEKLEEKFIKTNSDFKNLINDKINIENFLKTIFSKEMHDSVIQTEYGLYNTSELNKMFHVCESKKQNEFGQILNKYKNENSDLIDKNKTLGKELEIKVNELNNIKKTQSENSEQLNYYQNNYSDIVKKLEDLSLEKDYLMKLIDEKNEDIEKLMSLEVENAELKAKNLLENLENKDTRNSVTIVEKSTINTSIQNEKVAKIRKIKINFSYFKCWMSNV